ncbi:hypothetical protein LL912_21970 [Niabella sp. CC-SYL272]|uniref:hypothetical protein n=1 Tax=Niabella agricola TaxID=2891571 RepID=UPI001F21CAD5|nr:hypothetical protein [Niabella agricola]MCF3111469.1 hypothetical protein [Niabella agricola]
MKKINVSSRKWALLFMLGLACNNPQQEAKPIAAAEDSAGKTENHIMIPAGGCYAGQSGRDSFFLKAEVFPNVVTGKLTYRFHEKDKNEGTIEGVLKGDTLIADYTFVSEGKTSMRQVAFLLKDSIAIEGHGAMEEKDGKLLFSNRDSIHFNEGIQLHKVPCGE